MEVLVMIITESNRTNALKMAKLLIQNKLVACVSIKQIFSTYEMKDDIEETKEYEITIKSKSEFKDYLIEFLKKILHMMSHKLFIKNTIPRWNIMIGSTMLFN